MKNKIICRNIWDLFRKPGDELNIRVTKSNRKIAKVTLDDGKLKKSVTMYPNGTQVITQVIK